MKTLIIALNAHYMHTNLAVRILEKCAPGRDVALHESHINLPFRRLLSDIALKRADVLMFSCYIWNIELTLRLCRALKAARPELIICLGGPEVSHDAEAILARCLEVDFVMRGEGEPVIGPFLGACARGAGFESVLGLSGRSANGVFSAPLPPPVPPDQWPDVYANGAAGLERRIVYIETTRGCPYACQYCLSSDGSAVRALEADEAVRRLTALADAGVRLIKLVDRTFNFDRSRARRIWQALIDHAARSGARPTYHFEIGAHLIDEDAIATLERAPEGLFQLEAGIQSTHAPTLEAIGRTPSFDRIAPAIERLRARCAIHIHVDLIAGLPFEDMSAFARSFDDAYRLGADMLQLGFLKLIKGSTLRGRAEALGLRFEPDPPYEVLATPHMDFFELLHLKDVTAALDWYFNSGRYPAAMRLLTEGRSPFSVYAHLAHALRKAGTFDAERKEAARAEALLEHGAALSGASMLGALIRHDLLSCGRRRDLPPSLTFFEDDALRTHMRTLYPKMRGLSAFSYPFDPVHYAQTGALVRRPVTVVYGADGAVLDVR